MAADAGTEPAIPIASKSTRDNTNDFICFISFAHDELALERFGQQPENAEAPSAFLEVPDVFLEVSKRCLSEFTCSQNQPPETRRRAVKFLLTGASGARKRATGC